MDGSLLLDGVTADIGPGVSVIVGSVGSGKSTLLHVLLGELWVSSGEAVVRVQWMDEHQVPRQTEAPLGGTSASRLLSRFAAYVPQQPFIASSSVRENVPLAFGVVPNGEEDLRILRSLEAVTLGADLGMFPAGLSTVLGDRGGGLSGGQKQRLGIARAHYFGRSALLLDDPLSALDPSTQDELLGNLFGESEEDKPSTMIWVTHSPKLLGHADQVLVFDRGRIAAQGPPAVIGRELSSLLRTTVEDLP